MYRPHSVTLLHGFSAISTVLFDIVETVREKL